MNRIIFKKLSKAFKDNKGQMTFLLKALTLIASIIAFVMVVWNAQYFLGGTAKQKERAELRMQALSTLEKLTTKEDCLAYEFNGTVQKGVLDIEKINEFSKNYKSLEPKCARAYPFDYGIRIKQIPIKFKTHGYKTKGGGGYKGIFKEIKNAIDGKKVTFVIDASGSMNNDVKSNKPGINTKLDCVRELFLKAFVDELSDKTEIAIIRYSEYEAEQCVTPVRIPSSGGFIKLSGNRANIKSDIDYWFSSGYYSTPMCIGLKKAFKHSKKYDGEVIVLLTDGCENDCCAPSECCCNMNCQSVKNARKYKDLGVPVYTVGYGQKQGTLCYDPVLTEVARLTKGKPYHAETCEELIKKIPKKEVKVEHSEWSFGLKGSEITGGGVGGISQFSPKELREGEIYLRIPVSIRYAPDDYKRGYIEIVAIKGTLERVGSFLNILCENTLKHPGERIETGLKIYTNYPIYYNKNEKELCMKTGKEEICKKIDCAWDIEFQDIKSKGEYRLKATYIPRSKIKVKI